MPSSAYRADKGDAETAGKLNKPMIKTLPQPRLHSGLPRMNLVIEWKYIHRWRGPSIDPAWIGPDRLDCSVVPSLFGIEHSAQTRFSGFVLQLERRLVSAGREVVSTSSRRSITSPRPGRNVADKESDTGYPAMSGYVRFSPVMKPRTYVAREKEEWLDPGGVII